MTPHSSSRQLQGFTLIEVLVAMTIMAILAMMAWQGVDGIVRTREFSQKRLDQTLRLNTVMAQWELDLSSIQETAVPGRSSSGQFPTLGSLSFDGNTLRLLRRTDQGLQWVNWSLRPGALPGEQQLLRWTSTPTTSLKDLQDTAERTEQFVGTEPGQLRTLTGISQWQIYFFRGNSWSNAQSSGDAAPLGGATPGGVRIEALPEGVRLVLTFAEGSGLSGALTRDIALGPKWQ